MVRSGSGFGLKTSFEKNKDGSVKSIKYIFLVGRGLVVKAGPLGKNNNKYSILVHKFWGDFFFVKIRFRLFENSKRRRGLSGWITKMIDFRRV